MGYDIGNETGVGWMSGN